jgi:hypothetical protein
MVPEGMQVDFHGAKETEGAKDTVGGVVFALHWEGAEEGEEDSEGDSEGADDFDGAPDTDGLKEMEGAADTDGSKETEGEELGLLLGSKHTEGCKRVMRLSVVCYEYHT